MKVQLYLHSVTITSNGEQTNHYMYRILKEKTIHPRLGIYEEIEIADSLTENDLLKLKEEIEKVIKF